ncbi:MAG: hypothetical protein H7Z11_16260 [Verrucomicrobia bacterium]|nr:hypothetical protein [Leptolyngbya sp. ES-bin-22]
MDSTSQFTVALYSAALGFKSVMGAIVTSQFFYFAPGKYLNVLSSI